MTSHPPINVRGVDDALWRRFRAAAVLLNLSVGATLTLALEDWLRREEPKLNAIRAYRRQQAETD